MSENPITLFGDLSKPATVLIEKISEAIGGVFRPHQIRRVARAEADAATIQALAQIDISDIQRRALVRMIQEEGRRQQNIETISTLAIQDLRTDAKPENIDNDWLAHFFDKARLVSDTEMQTLWSKVLAGEANLPGTYSRRTVELVSTLDKADAKLFTTLCSFAWTIGNNIPVVFDATDSFYASRGVSFGSLTHLDDIGLITFQVLGGFVKQGLPKMAVVAYYGKEVGLELPSESGNTLRTGQVLLTKTGEELAPICGSTPSEEIYEFVLRKWQESGYILFAPPPQRRAT